MTKVLVISVAGMGSTLLAEPMIKHLKKKRPQWQVDLLCGQKGSRQLLEKHKSIDNIFFINRKITDGFFGNIKTLFKLFFNRYDYSILAFPANRIEFNLLSFLIFARKRIAHKYYSKKIVSGSFLNNKRIQMQKVHDIENNLNVLKLMGVHPANADKRMGLDLKQNELDKKNICGKYVCFHPGGSFDQPFKRWPNKKFACLADRLTEKFGYKVVIFNGPEERDAFKEICEFSKNKSNIIDGSKFNLREIAVIAKQSSLVVTNDSGIMHTAVAAKANVLAIYGASDWRRTMPYNDPERVIISGVDCQPCDRKLENLGHKSNCKEKGYLNKHGAYKCMDKLTVDKVFEKCTSMLDER